MPKPGVIWFHDRPVCYEAVERDGRVMHEARELGQARLMEMTPELQDAIRADQERERTKS